MLIYSARPSDGARNLATQLGIRRALDTGPAYTGHLINWGNTQLPARFRNATVINDPEDVAVVANKLTFFRQFQGEPRNNIVPWWSTNREIVRRKMVEDGCFMVCRRVLNGSGGAGIVVAHNQGELVDAPLYVEYVKKASEWRVHVFDNRIIDTQKKARRNEVPNPNWEIRNLEGGFIYARQNLDIPVAVTQAAERCMEAIDITFGAVDIVYNSKQNRAFVLEINSAPGLMGQTVESYAQAIRAYVRGRR